MQVGDDRRHAEFPLEPQRQVCHYADGHQQQGQRPVLNQFPANLRSDKIDAAQLHRSIVLAQRLDGGFGQLRAADSLLCRQPDERGLRTAETLNRRIGQIHTSQCFANLVDVRRVSVVDLHHRSPGELDTEVKALGSKEEYRQEEGDQ